MGLRGIPETEIILDDAEVPIDMVLSRRAAGSAASPS